MIEQQNTYRLVCDGCRQSLKSGGGATIRRDTADELVAIAESKGWQRYLSTEVRHTRGNFPYLVPVVYAVCAGCQRCPRCGEAVVTIRDGELIETRICIHENESSTPQ